MNTDFHAIRGNRGHGFRLSRVALGRNDGTICGTSGPYSPGLPGTGTAFAIGSSASCQPSVPSGYQATLR